MNIFFLTNVDKSLVRLYMWVPIFYFIFVSALLCVVFLDIPGLDQTAGKLDLIICIVVVFSGYILMFCVQVLARIESKLINIKKQMKNYFESF